MTVLTEGHSYLLGNFENPDLEKQPLQFIHKETTDDGSKTIANRTTNEEVLRILIDRMYYLQKKQPCRENSIVITNLEESLMWLEKRTADRIARGVEGTFKK